MGDPELPSGSFASIDHVSLKKPGPDTVASRHRSLLESIGVALLQRRLAELAAAQGYNFSNESVDLDENYEGIRIATLSAAGPSWRWNENLAALEQALRRALEYGFTVSKRN